MPPVETVVCAGDVVGYNPMPSKCLERVRSVASTVVQGNHDRAVDSPQKYLGNPAMRAGLEYAEAQLSDQQHSWLQTWPQTATVGDGEYLLVHSHLDPDRRGDYVFPTMLLISNRSSTSTAASSTAIRIFSTRERSTADG